MRIGFVGRGADVPQPALHRIPFAVRRIVAAEIGHLVTGRLTRFDAVVVVDANRLHDAAEALTIVGAKQLALRTFAAWPCAWAVLLGLVHTLWARFDSLMKTTASGVAAIVADRSGLQVLANRIAGGQAFVDRIVSRAVGHDLGAVVATERARAVAIAIWNCWIAFGIFDTEHAAAVDGTEQQQPEGRRKAEKVADNWHVIFSQKRP